MSWGCIDFGDLYLVPSKNGLNRPSRVRGVGYKMINMGELFANDRIRNITMELVPMNELEIEKYSIIENDLLFARQSIVLSGAGKCSIVLEAQNIVTFESHLIRVRLNPIKAVPLFYYYYFRSPYANMQSLVQHGVQAGIRASELKCLKVSYPPLDTQRKIASILSAYDDLIENNLRRIKLLEEAAQLIYKEWFVNFRFPGYEITKFVNGLPEGWENANIGDVLATIKRKGKLSSSDYLSEGVFPVVDQGDSYICGYTNNEEIIESENLPIIVFGDHTRRLKYVNFPFACGADGTQLIFPKDKNIGIRFLFYSLKNIDLSNYAYARHFKFLKKEKIILPLNIKLINKFETITLPIHNQMDNLRRQNFQLASVRDTLLPKLMSGEIEV